MANKNNFKKIIKQVINKSKCSKLSSEFLHNVSILNDKKSMANAFNAYFVNIGPTLASKIPNLGINYRNLCHNKIICHFSFPKSCQWFRSKENYCTIERWGPRQRWNNVYRIKMYRRPYRYAFDSSHQPVLTGCVSKWPKSSGVTFV